MGNQKTIEKLHQMVKQDLPSLEKNAILPDGAGNYSVFGIYKITKKRGDFLVHRYSNLIDRFSHLSTALSWCVADKFNQQSLADNILRLQRQQIIASDDLQVRVGLAQNIRQQDKAENIQIKLEHKRQQLKDINFRLTKCVNLAKYWQLRGFNNETARTGRTSSQRTSR